MKKKAEDQFLEIFKRSLDKQPKKLEAEWREFQAGVNMLLVRYHLYVKARKKRDKAPLELKEWIEAGKPEK